MRKLIVFNMISLDGYFEGPNRELDWHNVDDEFNHFAIDQLNNAGMLMFGRITYDLMAGYWPLVTAKEDDPIVAGLMNGIDKIVFSRTLKSVNWQNTRLVSDHSTTEVKNLKESQGKDIYIFGSSNLSIGLFRDRLIDEVRLMVNPIFLGSGKTLFDGLKNKVNLKLLNTQLFKSGNVLLYYQPV